MDKPAQSEPDSTAKKSLVPAVERAVRLLALLESAPQKPFALTEIARRLEIPRSTALNICSELVAAQLLRRAQSGYQLGRRLVQLGSAYVSSIDLVREFYEACRSIDPDLNAIIQLAVLDDQLNAVYLARQDYNSRLQLGLRAEIGRHVPANCTGSGKALLAALPLEDLEQRLAGLKVLPALTQNSISSPAKLRRELQAIRARGYATDNEEVLPGIVCIAAAVPTNHREDGLVAVSITLAREGLTAKRQKVLHAALAQLITEIQARL